MTVPQSCPIFCDPWTAACQVSLSFTNLQNLLKLMSIKSVMPSNHLIFCPPLLLPPSVFPSIRVFSNESALHIRWPKDWSFSFSISPSSEYSGLISFRMDWFGLLAVQRIQHHKGGEMEKHSDETLSLYPDVCCVLGVKRTIKTLCFSFIFVKC